MQMTQSCMYLAPLQLKLFQDYNLPLTFFTSLQNIKLVLNADKAICVLFSRTHNSSSHLPAIHTLHGSDMKWSNLKNTWEFD